MNNETFDPNNSVQRQRFYGTTPIYSALSKLHNFTEDAKELIYINWASVKPKIQKLPKNILKGLEKVIEKNKEDVDSIPCCGKNFGDISVGEVDLREYGLENRRRITTIYCEGEVLCKNREEFLGMNRCSHYSQSKDIIEL